MEINAPSQLLPKNEGKKKRKKRRDFTKHEIWTLIINTMSVKKTNQKQSYVDRCNLLKDPINIK